MKEWIQIIWVRPAEPVEEDLRVAARNAREDLKCRIGRGIRTCLTANDEDATICQNECGGIPTSALYDEQFED
jgi:hypothetical protein